MKVSFSLILFTYNQEKFVSQAVNAVLSQKCDPIEILITDDCSSDKTFDIVLDIVNKYKGPHKVLLNRNNKNLGLSGHIDKAHELSSGDVIIGAAGDDISHPNRCQKIIDCFKSKSPLLVFSYANVIDSNGKEATHGYSNATLYKSNDIVEIARSGSLYLGATAAWHRNLYDKYGSFEEDAYEDLIFGFRAALEKNFYVLDESLLKYRLGDGVTSKNSFLKNTESFKRNRIKKLKVTKAVYVQRLKDAITFGYSSKSLIIKTIEHELLKADIGIKFYSEKSYEFWSGMFYNPVLTFKRFILENFRIFRFKKNLKVFKKSFQL
ncbi:glycosyltransferase [Gammaproteobacteria bacterium]|nr:glycosyltransferase [Gammaproteobacteria bacterium]